MEVQTKEAWKEKNLVGVNIVPVVHHVCSAKLAHFCGFIRMKLIIFGQLTQTE